MHGRRVGAWVLWVVLSAAGWADEAPGSDWATAYPGRILAGAASFFGNERGHYAVISLVAEVKAEDRDLAYRQFVSAFGGVAQPSRVLDGEIDRRMRQYLNLQPDLKAMQRDYALWGAWPFRREDRWIQQ